MNQPLLSVNNLTHLYAPGKGFSDVSFDLWPGEVLGIVGESGSGKTTLLKSISARLTPQQGEIHYESRSLYAMSEADRRRLLRTEWGVVHQHPLDGLRRQVSAGGNIGERLMATGARHYGDIRATAQKWLEEVEIPANRIDDLPTTFSGGMQQRLQIARNLVTHPKLVFMDEPTGGLDVSVQARLLDLLRGLVVELNLAVVIVTHDLGVAPSLTCERDNIGRIHAVLLVVHVKLMDARLVGMSRDTIVRHTDSDPNRSANAGTFTNHLHNPDFVGIGKRE